jgi:hypothetical protein
MKDQNQYLTEQVKSVEEVVATKSPEKGNVVVVTAATLQKKKQAIRKKIILCSESEDIDGEYEVLDDGESPIRRKKT